ncbi:MAG: hypothetical protein ABWY93_23340 [Mycobacterium sp.]
MACHAFIARSPRAAAGGLRLDFVIDDLVLVLLAGRGLASTPPSGREASARRFAALAIDAFRVSEVNADLPRAPRLLRRSGAGLGLPANPG